MEKTKVAVLPNFQTALFWAARPKTLLMSIIPVVIGTLLAVKEGAKFDFILAFLAALTGFFVQIGTNYMNDALDFRKGADTPDRLGPERAVQKGWLTAEEMLRAGYISFIFAILCGIPLIIKGGIPLLMLVLISPVLGYAYTGGPFPIAYVGLAELFIIAFFGIASTSAAYYLQAYSLTWTTILCGLQIGILSSVVVSINNLRDIHTDSRVGKKTFAVRFGKLNARRIITLSFLVPYCLNIYWFKAGFFWAGILPFLGMGLALLLITKIWTVEPSKQYNQYLALGALHHLLFGLLLCVGIGIQ